MGAVLGKMLGRGVRYPQFKNGNIGWTKHDLLGAAEPFVKSAMIWHFQDKNCPFFAFSGPKLRTFWVSKQEELLKFDLSLMKIAKKAYSCPD